MHSRTQWGAGDVAELLEYMPSTRVQSSVLHELVVGEVGMQPSGEGFSQIGREQGLK